jgi:hypothetical protein
LCQFSEKQPANPYALPPLNFWTVFEECKLSFLQRIYLLRVPTS